MDTSLHRIARYLLLLLPLALAGCFEYACETVETTVQWDRDGERFDVRMMFLNVDVEMLDCDDVPECVAAVRLALSPAPDDPEESSSGFWPARELARDGASEIEVAFSRRGDLVDMLMRYQAPVGTDAAELTSVYVLNRGKPGREKPQLLVLMGEGSTLDAKRSRRYVLVDDEEPTEMRLLPRRVRSVTVTRPGKKEPVQPLLGAVPGLGEALASEGLVQAP